MPACSCPSICCSVCGCLPLVGGVVAYFFLSAAVDGVMDTAKYLSLNDQTITDRTDFEIRNFSIPQQTLQNLENSGHTDINTHELFMDAAAGTSCDDVFAKITLTVDCGLLDGCDKDKIPTMTNNCDSGIELTKPESSAEIEGPAKMVKVASFNAEWFEVSSPVNNVATLVTSSFRIKSDSDIYSGWAGGYELARYVIEVFNRVVLFANLGQSAFCFLCAGAIYALTASPPPAGTGAYNVQMQQPMHQQQMQQPMYQQQMQQPMA